jgi:hypothetical protein
MRMDWFKDLLRAGVKTVMNTEDPGIARIFILQMCKYQTDKGPFSIKSIY